MLHVAQRGTGPMGAIVRQERDVLVVSKFDLKLDALVKRPPGRINRNSQSGRHHPRSLGQRRY